MEHNITLFIKNYPFILQTFSVNHPNADVSLLIRQVVSIIEYHARTVDISTHNYYQLLYAFHTYRGNHRKGIYRLELPFPKHVVLFCMHFFVLK